MRDVPPRVAVYAVGLGCVMTLVVTIDAIVNGPERESLLLLIPFLGFTTLAFLGWRRNSFLLVLSSVVWLPGWLTLLNVLS